MPLLTTVDMVRAHLGFSDAGRIDAVIRSNLLASEVLLGSMLRTSFARGSFTDVFYVNHSLQRGDVVAQGRALEGLSRLTTSQGLETTLALSRGFLDAGQPQTIKVASKPGGFDASDAVDLATQAEVQLLWNHEKGSVVVLGYDLSRLYVRVTGTAGFEVSNEDPVNPLYQLVPDWLQQLAALQVTLHMQKHPILAGDNGAATGLDEGTIRSLLLEGSQGHIRYFPLAEKPL